MDVYSLQEGVMYVQSWSVSAMDAMPNVSLNRRRILAFFVPISSYILE